MRARGLVAQWNSISKEGPTSSLFRYAPPNFPFFLVWQRGGPHVLLWIELKSEWNRCEERESEAKCSETDVECDETEAKCSETDEK